MKKLFLGFALVLTVLGLSACTQLQTLATAYNFTNDNQILSFSAISTSTLLGETAVQPLAQTQSSVSQLSTTQPDVTIEQIQPYLSMFETLLSSNNGLTVTTDVSDNPLYETMNTFTVYDMLGNPVTYVMYFNQTALPSDSNSDSSSTDPATTDPTTTDPTSTDPTSTDPTSTDPQTTDSASNEQSYQIDGILIIGDVQYQFTGKKVIENGEEKVTFKSYTDDNNYVLSQYKTEDNEKKFSIKVVENGVTVNESKIKVEVENSELSIKLQYTQGSNTSNYSFKYETENGMNVLGIKYETYIDGVQSSGKITVQVIVDPVTNQTSYQILVKPDDGQEYEHESERSVPHEGDSAQHDQGDHDSNGSQNGNDQNPDDESSDSSDTASGATV